MPDASATLVAPELRSCARRTRARGEARGATSRLLPHETAFLILYALVVARLLSGATSPAAREVIVWCGFALASVALVWLTNARNEVWRWRVRLGAYVVIMNAVYLRMGAVHHVLGDARWDNTLQ